MHKKRYYICQTTFCGNLHTYKYKNHINTKTQFSKDLCTATDRIIKYDELFKIQFLPIAVDTINLDINSLEKLTRPNLK